MSNTEHYTYPDILSGRDPERITTRRVRLTQPYQVGLEIKDDFDHF
ncbi:MAG: hypothetical protein KJ935_02340 [Candidatus Omnitrophica bacterium]|nr:hypothetical protein [Candidatus Omnitrophota bacterium]